MSHSELTRRNFLAGLGAGAATVALGAHSSRVLGANDRLSLGVIGCGGRAGGLMGEVQKLAEEQNVEFTAICDVWRPAREQGAKRVKEWTGKEPRTFSRYQELLALEDVDAVIIATPDFAHSPILAAACRAGKDAYCEKPMATNLEDAKAAVQACREGQRVVQIGTQRRSSGRFRGAAKLIQSGVLGTVSNVHTCWHDAGPRWRRGYGDVKEEDVDWSAYLMDLPPRPFDPRRYRCWHLYKDYTNGTPGLLGSHMIDIGTWFMDDPLPTSCVAHGGVYVWKEREHADTLDCLYEYPKGFLLNYSTRLGNSFRLAEVILYGTRGTFDTSSWRAKGQGGGADKLTEEISPTDEPGESHMRNWLECIRTREDPNAPIELGYAHSVAAIMGFNAWESGRRQAYDHEKREIREG